jgi:hypothetical protein
VRDRIAKVTIARTLSRFPDGQTIHALRSIGEAAFGSDWSCERLEGRASSNR